MTAHAERIIVGPGTKARSTRYAIVVMAGVVAVVVVTVTTRARTFTEEDSANLARALHHYTVALDQPHAPGYPLVVLSAHAFTWIGSAVNAYVAVAVLGIVGTILMTYLLGLEMFGRRAAVVASLVVCATPLALYYGSIVSVYPTESLMVPTVALLAHRVARRADRWSAMALFPVLALGGGFRPTILILMLPACLVGMAFGRPHPRDVLAGLLVGIAIVAVWAIPMVVKSGGWHAYSKASGRLYSRQFSQTSVLYGASLHQAAFNAADTVAATAMVALPAVAVVVLAYRPLKSRWGARRPAMWILAASLVPYWVTFFAIQLGKPGYVLATLPIFAVLAGGLVAASARAVSVAVVVTVVVMIGYLVLPQWPLPWRLDAFFPAAHSLHVQDEEALGLRALARSCPRASCTIVSLPTSPRLWYHDPLALYRWYAPDTHVLASDDVSTDRAPLENVLWVGTTLPPAVTALATREGSIGTWVVYRSGTAVTQEIVREAFG